MILLQKSKPSKPVSSKVKQVEADYDSMIENGTDDDSNDDDGQEDDNRQESDSGQESGGRFVRALVNPDKKPTKGVKRKASDDQDEEHIQKIKALKQLYKAPTMEEINRLKETENFYHSNLFRLQVEEMLNEVKIKVKVSNYVEQWLGDFRKFLRTVKDSDSERSLKDVDYDGVDYPLEIPDDCGVLDKETFKFVQQRIVHQMGATRLGTGYGKPLKVDLLLEIPDKCFHKEDYRNMRYHLKRAHFLSHLAEALGKQSKYPLAAGMRFVPLKGDARKPVLELTPGDDKFAKRVVFVVHAVPMGKFSPNR